ncbi:MAG: hypothetical protein QOG59_2827, partial [Solirubrobacteraceae bacterium]|nr:hypothetical protein [Solirubrobacteraceae bacterium]
VMLTLGLAGCGGSSSSSSSASAGGTPPAHVHFAKTKFVLHAGLAFGAFHRYIYKPFRSGGFTPVGSHKLAIVKAGVAALFVYHEVKIALLDAQSSPVLSKLVSPLTALQTRMRGLEARLHGGQLDSSAINGASSDVSSLGSMASQAGAPVRDLATSALGG